MEEAAHLVLTRQPFHTFIQNHSLLFYDNKIIISLSMNPTFSELSNTDKFSLLQDIHVQTLHLLDGFNDKEQEEREIIIRSTSEDKQFEYSDKNKEKALYMSPAGILKEDHVIVMAKQEYQNTNKISSVSILSDEDQQILDYMSRLFKIMTKNGLDYNPQRDNELIMINTMDKFKIENEERLITIIKKYIDNQKFLYNEKSMNSQHIAQNNTNM